MEEVVAICGNRGCVGERVERLVTFIVMDRVVNACLGFCQRCFSMNYGVQLSTPFLLIPFHHPIILLPLSNKHSLTKNKRQVNIKIAFSPYFFTKDTHCALGYTAPFGE